MRARSIAILCTALLIGAVSYRADAQTSAANVAAAESLFNKAMELMKAGKYAEACPKLEESQKLDPAIGTQFRLAECYEKIDKIASAWALFVTVADEAVKQKDKKREGIAQKRAAALETKLTKLTIQVPPEVSSLAGLDVQLDGTSIGKALWEDGIPLDAGDHSIVVTANGKRQWEQKVHVDIGQSTSVKVRMLEDLPKEEFEKQQQEEKKEPVVVVIPKSTGSTQAAIALAGGGVGLAGIIVGSVFGVRALSQWDNMLELCQEKDPLRCPTSSNPNVNELYENASTAALISNITFAVGGAGLVAGAVLWFTADSGGSNNKKTGIVFVPSVSSNGAGGVVVGTF